MAITSTYGHSSLTFGKRRLAKRQQGHILKSLTGNNLSTLVLTPHTKRPHNNERAWWTALYSLPIVKVQLHVGFWNLDNEKFWSRLGHLPSLETIELCGEPLITDKNAWLFLRVPLSGLLSLFKGAKKLRSLVVAADVEVYGSRSDLYGFCESMSYHSSLTTFEWKGHLRVSQTQELPIYECICLALLTLPRLQKLVLDVPLDPFDPLRRGPDVSVVTLKQLCHKCTSVSVWTDHIAELGDLLLADRTNTSPLKSLSVTKNNVSKADMGRLAAFVSHQSTIQHLSVTSCGVLDATIGEELITLQDALSLQTLCLSHRGRFLPSNCLIALLQTNGNLSIYGDSSLQVRTLTQFHQVQALSPRQKLLHLCHLPDEQLSVNCLYLLLQNDPSVCSFRKKSVPKV